MRKFVKVSLILVWSSEAPAEIATSHTEVHWHAIQGCPSESALKHLVEEQLGAPLDAPREQSLSVDASLRKAKNGEYRVTIVTRGNSGRGRRQLANSDCDKLTEAAALVIAIAIDPKRLETAKSAPTEIPTQPGEAHGEPEQPRPPRNDDGAVAATHQPPKNQLTHSGTVALVREPLRLEARPFVGAGFLPGTDLGVMALIGYFPMRQIELRAGVTVLTSREKPVGFAPGALSMNALALEAGACVHPLARRLQPSVCLLSELGLLFAHGENLANPQNQRALVVSFVSELGYAHYLGQNFGGLLSIQAGVTPVRPRFGVQRNGVSTQLFQPPVGIGRVGLGFFWLFR
ncbi:MAG: hypothetical protein ACM3ZE_00895 [Myxococcales bacterium]